MSARRALEASRPTLVGVDVEGGDELDVADVVAAELDVHQTGDPVGRVGVLVVGEALHQRARAVAHAGDGEADSGHCCSSWMGAWSLHGDEPIEPGKVVDEVLGVALAQRTEVGVVARGLGAATTQVVATAEELGAPPLEELEPGAVGEVAGEGDPERELPVVADVGGGEELDEPLAAEVGDARTPSCPARCPWRALTRARGPGRRPARPASEPDIGAARDGGALLDGLDGALRLEAGERRVERAEADRGAAREQLTEPLLQLVAVELLLREQAEDGEVDHGGVVHGRYIGVMYRFDVTDRVYER